MPSTRTAMLCLVSEQTMANAIAIKQLDVDQLLLVHTDDPSRSVEPMNQLRRWWLQTEWWDRREQPPPDVQPFLLANRTNLRAIYDQLRGATAVYPDAHWIINVTGGTKPMSFGAYMLASESDAEALYVDTDAGKLLWFRPTMREAPIDVKFKVAEVLALHGLEVRETTPPTCRERAAAPVLRAHRPFVSALNKALENARQAAEDRDPANVALEGLRVPRDDAAVVALRRCGVLLSHQLDGNSAYRVDVDESQRELLKGRWLEVLVALAFEEAGADEVACGVCTAGATFETDVVATFGPRLVAAECKTGRSLAQRDFAAFAEHMERLGGSGAIGVMIWSPPSSAPIGNLRERAAAYRERAAQVRVHFWDDDDLDHLSARVLDLLGHWVDDRPSGRPTMGPRTRDPLQAPRPSAPSAAPPAERED